MRCNRSSSRWGEYTALTSREQVLSQRNTANIHTAADPRVVLLAHPVPFAGELAGPVISATSCVQSAMGNIPVPTA